MEIREIKDAIEKWGEDKFYDLIRDEDYASDEELAAFTDAVGLSFEFLSSERAIGSGDYDGWTWRFKLGEKIYEANGYYSSHEGIMDHDLMGFYEVIPVQETITVYKKVKI